jgi:ABC-type antimicrobial peptide transport system permease subunit
LVRSTTDIQTLPALIREAIWSVDPNLPVDEVVPLGNRVETSLAGRRFLTILLGTFATVALILATGGIYASMLYSVGQRKKEMGIRLAMGAGRGRVVGLVLRSALVQTLLGVAIGLAGSVGVSILLRSWLVGIAVLDRVTLGGGVLVLSSAALLASAVPALRAARTDPVETLHVE